MKSRYACPECGGCGVEECSECGAPRDCEACLGSGLDPDRVNVSAYLAATKALLIVELATMAWIENGELVGRRGNVGHVRIVDFLLKEESDA